MKRFQICNEIFCLGRGLCSVILITTATHSRGQTGPFCSENVGPVYLQRFAPIIHLNLVPTHAESFFSTKAHWSSPFKCLHLSLFFFIWEGSGLLPQGWTPVLTTSIRLFTFPVWVLIVRVFLIFFKSFLPAHVPPFHGCLSISSSSPLWFSAPLMAILEDVKHTCLGSGWETFLQ